MKDMLANHKKLLDLKKKCADAKKELSDNLKQRLTYVFLLVICMSALSETVHREFEGDMFWDVIIQSVRDTVSEILHLRV